MSGPNRHERGEIRPYLIGYAAALALTCTAFAAVRWQSFGGAATLGIVLALALVQIVIHFRFFLHISLARSGRDHLLLILFSTLIVVLMVSGTLVVLMNLRARMM